MIGANGAGKSTLLKAIVGLVARARGHDRLPRRAASTAPRPERLVRDGPRAGARGQAAVRPDDACARTSSSAPTARAASGGRRSPRASSASTRSSRCSAERAGQPAETLSGGEQQMLAVGAGAHVAAAPAAARRAVARPRAQGHRRDLRGRSTSCAPRASPSCSSSRTRAWRSSTPTAATSCGPAASCWRGRRADLLADESVRTIYLGAWRGEGEER